MAFPILEEQRLETIILATSTISFLSNLYTFVIQITKPGSFETYTQSVVGSVPTVCSGCWVIPLLCQVTLHIVIIYVCAHISQFRYPLHWEQLPKSAQYVTNCTHVLVYKYVLHKIIPTTVETWLSNAKMGRHSTVQDHFCLDPEQPPLPPIKLFSSKR